MQYKKFAMLIVSIAGLSSPCVLAQAPSADKPIRLVVPFPAGGAADLIGRALGQKLSVFLGQAVLIDNKAGAAGAIGSDNVAKALPDGLTLLLGTISSHATGPALNPKMPYDPVKDFTHISMIASNPLVFIVHPSVPVSTLPEFVRYANGKPGIPFGSNGNGSYNHLAVELFKSQAQIDLLHVPYKGAAPVMNDLVSGQIMFAAADLAGATPFIRSGKVKALAVATTQRLPGFDIPTVMESGYPTFEVTAWYALFGPPGMPQFTLSRIHAAVVKALGERDIQERFQSIGAIPVIDTPAQLRDKVQREVSRWSAVVKAGNITTD